MEINASNGRSFPEAETISSGDIISFDAPASLLNMLYRSGGVIKYFSDEMGNEGFRVVFPKDLDQVISARGLDQQP